MGGTQQTVSRGGETREGNAEKRDRKRPHRETWFVYRRGTVGGIRTMFILILFYGNLNSHKWLFNLLKKL